MKQQGLKLVGNGKRQASKKSKNESTQKILEPTKTQRTFNKKFSGYKMVEGPSFYTRTI